MLSIGIGELLLLLTCLTGFAAGVVGIVLLVRHLSSRPRS